MTDIVDQLNRLLTVERAGVEALCGLVAQAPTSEIRSLFGQMRDDEAWTCTSLVGCLARLAHRPMRAKGDVPGNVLALPALPDRVRLLNRGQRWVVERIEELLSRDLDADTRAFLAKTRAVHLGHIRRFDELLVELERQREVTVDRRSDTGPSLER
jgi:nitronate monooxygenase